MKKERGKIRKCSSLAHPRLRVWLRPVPIPSIWFIFQVPHPSSLTLSLFKEYRDIPKLSRKHWHWPCCILARHHHDLNISYGYCNPPVLLAIIPQDWSYCKGGFTKARFTISPPMCHISYSSDRDRGCGPQTGVSFFQIFKSKQELTNILKKSILKTCIFLPFFPFKN